VDGGTVSSEDEFWQVVIEQLDIFQSTEGVTVKPDEKRYAGSQRSR
jgi:hypothetical protein